MMAGVEIHSAISHRSSHPSRRPPPARIPSEGIAALAILVVEDEPVVGWAMQSLLEDLGHDVIEVAASGPAALAAADTHQPDLVFMDINLGGGMDGIEAAIRIVDRVGAKIVFATAYADPGTKEKIAQGLPGTPLISKPVSPASVRDAIATLFAPRN